MLMVYAKSMKSARPMSPSKSSSIFSRSRSVNSSSGATSSNRVLSSRPSEPRLGEVVMPPTRTELGKYDGDIVGAASPCAPSRSPCPPPTRVP